MRLSPVDGKLASSSSPSSSNGVKAAGGGCEEGGGTEVTQLLFFDTFSHDAGEELNLDLVQFPSPVVVEEVRVIPLGAQVRRGKIRARDGGSGTYAA